MSTTRQAQELHGFTLLEPFKAARFDVASGVAARVAWQIGQGTLGGGDTLKVMIDPGHGAPDVDFATPKALDATTKIVQISQDEMRGVSRLAIVKSGTATTGTCVTASIFVTQDLD